MCTMDLLHMVLVRIFKYLSESDQKAARMTCRAWYIAGSTHFMKKMIIFDNITLNDEDLCPLQIFTKSTTKYCKFLFKNAKISSDTSYFWNEVGANITILTMEDCDLTQDMLYLILKSCPNIQELNINGFQNYTFTVNNSRETIFLEKLKVLRVLGNACLIIELIFNKFIKTPALEELHICSHIHGADRQQNICFAAITQIEPKSLKKWSPLTFSDAIEFITSTAKSLKRLVYSNPYINASDLKELSEVKELQLESLHVHFAYISKPNKGILALSNHQTSIKELNLSACRRYTDENFALICRKLVNLECLNIQACSVTDVGIIHVKKLKLLKSLNISESRGITKIGVEHGICPLNETLKELDVSYSDLCEDAIIMLSERLSLRVFDVSLCEGVNDDSIKHIFKNQVNLHTFKMSHVRITDVGLSDPFCSIRRLAHLRDLDISGGYRITDVSLRSLNFKDLRQLDMRLCNATTSGLQGLIQGCPNIEYLNMINCLELWREKVAVREIVKGLPRLKQIKL